MGLFCKGVLFLGGKKCGVCRRGKAGEGQAAIKAFSQQRVCSRSEGFTGTTRLLLLKPLPSYGSVSTRQREQARGFLLLPSLHPSPPQCELPPLTSLLPQMR